MSVLEVIHTAFRLTERYFRDIIAVVLITAGGLIALIDIYLSGFATAHPFLFYLLYLLFDRLLPLYMIAFLAILVYRQEHHRKYSFRATLIETATRVPYLILVMMLIAITALIGFALFIVPGIIFIVIFSQSYMYTLLEGINNPFRSLSASERLTRQNRLKIVIIYAMFAAVYLTIQPIIKATGSVVIGVAYSITMSAFLTMVQLSIWSHLKGLRINR